MLLDHCYIGGIQKKSVCKAISSILEVLGRISLSTSKCAALNYCRHSWVEDLVLKPQETCKSSPKASKDIEYVLSKLQSKERKKKALATVWFTGDLFS